MVEGKTDMEWEEPTLTEINLDAEIGSYQDDFSDDPRWPIAEGDPPKES
jgi:hypothetical protein